MKKAFFDNQVQNTKMVINIDTFTYGRSDGELDVFKSIPIIHHEPILGIRI